ncbi:hypothetical protein J6590_043184 [Homalodisca vitripennis]|nr:hypothetical protein J6590_043184 [Homalodisca vitripennis]
MWRPRPSYNQTRLARSALPIYSLAEYIIPSTSPDSAEITHIKQPPACSALLSADDLHVNVSRKTSRVISYCYSSFGLTQLLWRLLTQHLVIPVIVFYLSVVWHFYCTFGLTQLLWRLLTQHPVIPVIVFYLSVVWHFYCTFGLTQLLWRLLTQHPVILVIVFYLSGWFGTSTVPLD